MAPIVTFRILRRDDQGDDGNTLGPIYILGIVLACTILVGIAVWLVWRRWKKGSAFEPDMISEKDAGLNFGPRPQLSNGFNRAQMTASIILPAPAARPINEKQAEYEYEEDAEAAIPYLPPLRRTAPLMRQIETSDQPPVSAPPRAHSSAPLRGSTLRQSFIPCMMQNGGSPRATMTENEILDYHLNQGNMPTAFAPIAIESGNAARRQSVYAFGAGNPRASQFSMMNGSVTASVLSSVERDEGLHRDSSSTVSSLPWPKLNAGPRRFQSPTPARNSHFGHSRLSSFAASIRFPGSSPPTSPARSVFTFGKKHSRQISQLPMASTDNQRTVVIASFQPLLPDELVLRQDEVMTVVQSYDDGWCIVARMNLGMLEMGAVPEWVFGLQEGEDDTFGTMRPMRSTSLGVTVDLRVIESTDSPERHLAPAQARDSLVSWSNF